MSSRLAAALFLGVLACATSACAATPDTAAGLRSWITQSGYRSSVALLRADVAEIRRGIAAARLVETHTACDGLGSDAASAVGELPTPDHGLTLVLNAAYSTLLNGAEACTSAGGFAAAGFARFRRDAAAGLKGLDKADRRIAGLQGR